MPTWTGCFLSPSPELQVNDATSRASILDDLGYDVADNLVSDLVILVEGPSDAAVIEQLLRKMGLLESHSIKIWPLGGDIMDKLDLSVFAENYSLIALIDQDPGSKSVRRRFCENCAAHSIPVHRLKRYSIENYFPLTVLREVMGSQIPETLTEVNARRKLESQLGFDVRSNNRRIAQKMSLDDIRDTDLSTFAAT
jgi:predicted ATP-dependent endonuclease of OLD family